MSAHAEVPPAWLSPTRRQTLRAGARAFTALERAFQIAYRAHQEDRRAADDRRS